MPTRTLLHVFSTFTAGGPQIRFAALANHFGRAYRHIVVAMDGVTCAVCVTAAPNTEGLAELDNDTVLAVWPAAEAPDNSRIAGHSRRVRSQSGRVSIIQGIRPVYLVQQ